MKQAVGQIRQSLKQLFEYQIMKTAIFNNKVQENRLLVFKNTTGRF